MVVTVCILLLLSTACMVPYAGSISYSIQIATKYLLSCHLTFAVSVAEDLPANYFQSSLLTHPASSTTTAIKVLNMNWVDTATYPPERVDLLLGSDLVYDASILTVLVPAICSTLSAGKYILLLSAPVIICM